MPAPAVIPALVVYVEVAAVKELVVGFRNAEGKVRLNGVARFPLSIFRLRPSAFTGRGVCSESFTLIKFARSKQA